MNCPTEPTVGPGFVVAGPTSTSYVQVILVCGGTTRSWLIQVAVQGAMTSWPCAFGSAGHTPIARYASLSMKYCSSFVASSVNIALTSDLALPTCDSLNQLGITTVARIAMIATTIMSSRIVKPRSRFTVPCYHGGLSCPPWNT